MAKLVYCRVCRNRISEEAAREVKGALCCPPCYERLVAKMKAQKEQEKEEAKKRKSERSSAVAAGTAPAAAAKPVTPSERLARKATTVAGARQLAAGHGVAPAQGPAAPDLPDLPDAAFLGTPRQGGRFSIGPSALGRGIYFALTAAATFVGYLLAAKSAGDLSVVPQVILGLAAVAGAAAVVAGLFNVLASGEFRKQISGGLAIVAGLVLAGYGGKTCISTIIKLSKEGDLAQQLTAPKQPEPKPEPQPEFKPEPKPEPKPQPKPEPKPESKPTPEPSAAEKLRAEMRALLPGAAAVEAEAIGLGGPTLKKLEELADQPLTAVVVLSWPAAAGRPDVEPVGSGPKSAAELAEAMRIGGHLSVLRDDAITKLDCLILDNGERVDGQAEVKGQLYQGRFQFEARRSKEGKWRLSSFTLPRTMRRVEQNAAGKWRVSELPTRDTVLRLGRLMAGVDLSKLPSAAGGRSPDISELTQFGELRVPGAAPKPLGENGRGVVLGFGADAKFSQILAEAKDGDAWRPVAVLTAGAKGPFFLLPEISTKEPADARQLLAIAVEKKGETFEMAIRGGARLAIDAKGLAALYESLLRLRGATGMQVKVSPDPDTPLLTVVTILDYCLQGGVQLNRITLDPGTPAGPAGAAEEKKAEEKK